MTETRYQRVAREQRERQERRAAMRAAVEKAYGKPKRDRRHWVARQVETYEDRLDDLGESPDF